MLCIPLCQAISIYLVRSGWILGFTGAFPDVLILSYIHTHCMCVCVCRLEFSIRWVFFSCFSTLVLRHSLSRWPASIPACLWDTHLSRQCWDYRHICCSTSLFTRMLGILIQVHTFVGHALYGLSHLPWTTSIYSFVALCSRGRTQSPVHQVCAGFPIHCFR